MQSCWAQRPKDRPTFAQLSVALGQLSVPSPSQGAGARAVPTVSPGLVVTAASLSDQDLFVLRSTGALVTVTWLFENGYNKTDCDSVAEVAAAARGSLRETTPAAAAHIETLTDAIARVEQESSQLAANRASTSTRIQTEVAAAIECLTSNFARRAEVLHGDLSVLFDARDEELTLQLDALAAHLAYQQVVFTTGQDSIGKNDVQVVGSKFDVTT